MEFWLQTIKSNKYFIKVFSLYSSIAASIVIMNHNSDS